MVKIISKEWGMEAVVNGYQLSKTLRFGLTPNEKAIKSGYKGEIYESHSELKELVIESKERILGEVKPLQKSSELPTGKIRKCFKDMRQYLQIWKLEHSRYDQIAVLKDYYKKLERKAKFDGFWESGGKKMPQSQIIKLSSLNRAYENKKLRDYIVDYWSKNIKTAEQRVHDFDPVLKRFEEAEAQNRNNEKLNEVELRKMFLSITNLINDTLEPLCNGSICFPDIEKITENENDQSLRSFVFDNEFKKEELCGQIEELKTYFKENGGYVPYAKKVTLNKYTALQKPNRVDEDIDAIIEKLKLQDLAKKYKNGQGLNDFIALTKDKSTEMDNEELSLVERIQLFKYKTIPVGVQAFFVEYLRGNKDDGKEDVKTLLKTTGMPQSPAEDYKNLKDKKNFNLHKYPLKVAFDYAWESLAKSVYNHSIDFPKSQCESFLKDVFCFDINDRVSNKNFQLYASLQFMRENLATLDYNEPIDRRKHIDNVNKAFADIDSALKANHKKAKEAIIKWQNDYEALNKLKKTDETKYNARLLEYSRAKQTIGQLRGGLKNRVPEFSKLTQLFKKLSLELGGKFTTLRDKFNEEYEINKISHYGIVIEDKNRDRYILLSKLSDGRKEVEELFNFNDETADEITTYQVKSLTSKALWKFLKNKKGASNDFHTKEEWQFPKGERETINKDKTFLDYVKECLTNSKMAGDQDWAEFGWDFDKCKSYEDIAKEVDRKGYILKDKKHISKKAIEALVKEKDCLLLPIVNQDIIVENRDYKLSKNQFTKDWIKIFERCDGYRLHPEFKISYRHPTPTYPKPEEKRYSRFQMIAHLLCEFIPKEGDYISRKEQIKVFNNKKEQENAVKEFSEKIHFADSFYILGIDRGLKQLATLCVLNKDGQIQGDFEIYTRKFDKVAKQWKHAFFEKRNILDLSNLRVETTVDGRKVLVDLSSILVRDKEDKTGKLVDNQQKIKLKQLAYIRKLQFQMQRESEKVLAFIKQCASEKDVEEHIEELITRYKDGDKFADLPTDKIWDMLQQFKDFSDNNDEASKRELIELDSTNELKNGIVANMIGVIAYLLERYDYKVYISLEDLTKAFPSYNPKDGLSSIFIEKYGEDFKEIENKELAGVGFYQFFEIQLLKKLFRIQQEDGNILHLVPAFRSVDNYEKIVRRAKKDGDEYVNYPFGIARFVDPKYTSKKCPICGQTNVKRVNNIIICHNAKCGKKSGEYDADDKNKNYIINGDDNAAYHIALKTLENLEKRR
jgi:hypothetical protein